MVLLYPLKLVVAPHVDVGRDLIQFALLALCLNVVPVFFIGSLHRLLSQLNRALEASFLFQTVR